MKNETVFIFSTVERDRTMSPEVKIEKKDNGLCQDFWKLILPKRGE